MAIYHRLAAFYQVDLEAHYQEDYLEMEENTFINTLLNYKIIDKKDKKNKETARVKLKADKKLRRTRVRKETLKKTTIPNQALDQRDIVTTATISIL